MTDREFKVGDRVIVRAKIVGILVDNDYGGHMYEVETGPGWDPLYLRGPEREKMELDNDPE